eukprot:scaffold10312_cov149-Amphora_coffeaeformis.AAC.2
MKPSAVVSILAFTVLGLVAQEAQGLLLRVSEWRTHRCFAPLRFSSALDDDDDDNNNNNNNNSSSSSKIQDLRRPSIARLAVRKYVGKDSKPSGQKYTTRKDAVEACHVTPHGLDGDYNHYRTVALQGTPDRAVSLWTSDCAAWLQHDHQLPVQPGDLGENMYVEHLTFDDLAVGQRLLVGETVVLEISEPVIPCANLCKLLFINQPDKSPSQRIQACQEFLEILDQAPGLRGWYAKVIISGQVRVHDVVELITKDEDEHVK